MGRGEMRKWYFSCDKFTVVVTTDRENRVVDAPPIMKRFIGKHVKEVTDMMKKVGGFTYKEITRG